MITNRKVYGRAIPMPAGIMAGATISLLIMLLGCVIVAVMTQCEMVSMDNWGYGAMIILLLSSFTGAVFSSVFVKRRRLVVCLSQAGTYLGILILINIMLFGGQFSGLWATAVLIFGGAGTAILLTAREKTRPKNLSRKWRTG